MAEKTMLNEFIPEMTEHFLAQQGVYRRQLEQFGKEHDLGKFPQQDMHKYLWYGAAKCANAVKEYEKKNSIIMLKGKHVRAEEYMPCAYYDLRDGEKRLGDLNIFIPKNMERPLHVYFTAGTYVSEKKVYDIVNVLAERILAAEREAFVYSCQMGRDEPKLNGELPELEKLLGVKAIV